eukprot:386944_1
MSFVREAKYDFCILPKTAFDLVMAFGSGKVKETGEFRYAYDCLKGTPPQRVRMMLDALGGKRSLVVSHAQIRALGGKAGIRDLAQGPIKVFNLGHCAHDTLQAVQHMRAQTLNFDTKVTSLLVGNEDNEGEVQEVEDITPVSPPTASKKEKRPFPSSEEESSSPAKKAKISPQSPPEKAQKSSLLSMKRAAAEKRVH